MLGWEIFSGGSMIIRKVCIWSGGIFLVYGGQGLRYSDYGYNFLIGNTADVIFLWMYN